MNDKFLKISLYIFHEMADETKELATFSNLGDVEIQSKRSLFFNVCYRY